MVKQITVVLLGAGNRADKYASLCFEFPEKLKVVGIVDPDPIRTKLKDLRHSKVLQFGKIQELNALLNIQHLSSIQILHLYK